MVDPSTKHPGVQASGGCFCGAVRYDVAGPLRGVVHCHCSQCAKLNGNFGSHSKALRAHLQIIRDEGLAWYQISPDARRGFCGKCGSALFWDQTGQNAVGIIAGSIDPPTGLTTIGHIFVDSKPDFYEIADDAPKFSGSSDGKLEGDVVLST